MQAIVRRAVLESGLNDLEIQTAANGEEALELVEERFTPDLVMTDWHMPGMSGLELVQNLKQISQGTIRFAFVTTETHQDRLREANLNGASFILNKPFNDNDLREQLLRIREEIAEEKVDTVPAADSLGPEPAPDKVPPPIDLDQLQSVLKRLLAEVPFRLVERDMMPEHLTRENMIVLYRCSMTQKLAAVGVLDMHAVCMIGAALQKMQPKDAQPIVSAGAVSADIQQRVGRLVEKLAALITHPRGSTMEMNKFSMVPKDFSKVSEVLTRNRGSAFFRLDIPGYGSGRLAFVLV